MNPAKFLDLNLSDRVKVLYENGAFVVAIRYYGYKVNLYLLNGFYVEVFYNHKLDKIEKVLPMEKYSSRMKFYADQISLPSELLN